MRLEKKLRIPAIAALLLLGSAALVSAQSSQPNTEPGSAGAAPNAAATPVPVTTGSVPQAANQTAESEAPQTLHLLVGRSLVITSPVRIKRLSLADPSIAEALVVSPYQVLVNGKVPGGVSLLIWDENDQSQAFEVSVDIDVLGLSQKIHEVFPTENVHIDTSRDVVILTGHISSAAVADKILEVVKGAAPKVTSMMQVPVAPVGEILLQVRFAEVDRNSVNQLGFNFISLPGAKNIGTISTQQFAPPQLVGNSPSGGNIGVSDLLNIFLFRPDINLAATIKALQERNLLQILAEPNLLTQSGKDASFLAGGEFPFPTLQGTGAGGFAGITVQFKEFGIRLNFTPTLTPDGNIHLKVKPEVSALDFANGLTLQGFLIPALSTRRVESEMDLGDGQSFAIAGLVDNRVTEQFSKLPWIGDVPVIGKLFQSKSFTRSRNELLVIVTPRIVQPLTAEKVPHGPEFPVPFMSPTGTDTKAVSPK